MKKFMLRTILGTTISMMATTGLLAEELNNTSYYDCGFNSENLKKCVLYMPSVKMLAIHTAGTKDDYERIMNVEANFDNGVLTLPSEITGFKDTKDNEALSNRSDVVDFYYIQQNVNGNDGKPMFYLYSPIYNTLSEHEAGEMGAENVTKLTDTKLADGSFSFDIATGIATATPALDENENMPPMPPDADIPVAGF